MKEFPTLVPVAAVALIDDHDRVLMQRRPPGRDHAGLWEFPGGKVEPGETAATAAIREAAEELGIAIAATDLEPIAFAAADDAPVVILLYTVRRWQGAAQSREGALTGWFTADALAGLAMPPLDVPLATRVAAMLKNGN